MKPTLDRAHNIYGDFCRAQCTNKHFALCEHNMRDAPLVRENVCRLYAENKCAPIRDYKTKLSIGDKYSCGECIGDNIDPKKRAWKVK